MSALLASGEKRKRGSGTFPDSFQEDAIDFLPFHQRHVTLLDPDFCSQSDFVGGKRRVYWSHRSGLEAQHDDASFKLPLQSPSPPGRCSRCRRCGASPGARPLHENRLDPLHDGMGSIRMAEVFIGSPPTD